MGWRIVMIEHGEVLRLKLDNLYVRKGQDEYTIPLDDINMIILSNLNATVTGRLLDAAGKHNIALVVCDRKHMPSGIYTALNPHSRASKMMRMQVEWTDEFKDITWKKIVHAKIRNQNDVMVSLGCNDARNELMTSFLNRIENGDITNREGHAAKVYFNSVFGMDFIRGDKDDIRNACLDYLYAIVRAFISRLIVAYGFTGMIGVHHKSEYNTFALTDDLMEPFRPLCDRYVIDNLHDDSVFDFEMRKKLVDFLNMLISYNGQKVNMTTLMEKYIISFISYVRSDGESEIVFPEVADGEV